MVGEGLYLVQSERGRGKSRFLNPGLVGESLVGLAGLQPRQGELGLDFRLAFEVTKEVNVFIKEGVKEGKKAD